MIIKSNLLHQPLEKRARLDPNKTALIFKNQKISYFQLNRRSDYLASYLLQHGLKQEEFVLVMTDKSAEMIYALFGILKAGGTYIPIDSEIPDERLQYIIKKSTPKIVLTESKYEARLKKCSKGTEIILLDALQFSNTYKKNYLVKINKHQLAYIIFTSGTTGKPKGVMLEHSAVANTISSLIDRYHISEKSRLLQFSSIAFDSSVAEIFSVITAGGTLILASTSKLRDISKLSSLLKEEHITVVTLPPALLNYMDFSDNTSLDTLVSAGEECSTKLANRMYKQVPHFINAYGPTECSICVTTYEVHSELSDTVPIGTPISGTEIFLLDEEMIQVPQGKEGEMYVSGNGLARGYLHDKTKTNSSFIFSPFNKKKILYRTHDRAILLKDGNYAFLGRKDLQVKVRGNRIELEEIEKTLRDLELISSIAVCLGKNAKDESIINCYYVSAKVVESQYFRDHLKKRLPSYMIPHNFIHLEEMPLNTSGKIDRVELQHRIIPHQELSKITVPKDENQKWMRDIWIRLFEKNDIGDDNNFFDLGGDSLLAMRLISEVNSQFNTDVDIVSVFEYPILSQFADYINMLSKPTHQAKVVLGEKKSKLYKLSSAQKMFWVAYKLDPHSAVNNITTVLNIYGKVDILVLEKSFQYVVDKHEALRTNIIEKNGQGFQKIHKFLPTQIRVYTPKDKTSIDKEILKISSHFFELETESLINATLLKIDEKKSKLIFVVHHIIADALSLEILLDDFFRMYNIFSHDELKTSILKTQYKDFVSLEESVSHQFKIEQMGDFWLKYLQGCPSFVDLPTDYPKKELIGSSEGKIFEKKIDQAMTAKMHELAKKLGVTPYILLFSVFNLFIHRISNQEDIAIGTPVNIRPGKSFQNTIGPFINTTVVRSTLTDDPIFLEYISKIRQNFMSVFKHQEYPFNKIVEELNITRNYGKNPIFNIMFDYFRESSNWEIDGVAVESEIYDNHTSKFDLTFSLTESAQGNSFIRAEYSALLFKEQTIQRLVDNFLVFLNSVCDNYTQRISKLVLVSEKEKKTILNIFNNTNFQFSHKSFIEIFEEQVQKRPNNIAVKFDHQTLTYVELNKKANQLAHHLLSLKKGIDIPVGVLLERSPELVISIIAIWKAGCVYVPLETEYPAQRIEEMIAGSKLKTIISQRRYNFLVTGENQIVNLDENLLESQPGTNVGNFSPSSSLAYIIFTSGSTQKPKGVMIEHRGMMNHLFIMIDYFGLSSNSNIAQNASHCFDISIWQLVCALLIGGSTVIYSKEIILNPVDFLQRINVDEITILEAVPSFLNVLLEVVGTQSVEKYPLPKLQYLLPTGESVKPTLIKRWFQSYPNTQVANAYGPAEASDDTNFYLMKETPAESITNIPAGKPLKNIKTYILDKNLNLCPIGVYGEICIAGIAVGRGYINNPVKTAESFIDDPFSISGEVRLYKTGDIGRWLDDGNIEFFGRKDFQVKIHGFRIELEEIERRLAEHSQVKEVAVIDHVDSEENKYLVAYYTSRKRIPFQELKNFLLKKLPNYMVPSFFVRLNALPLNNSGKIDRKSLPLPKSSQNAEQKETLSASTKEEMIIQIWQRILKKKTLKPTDNFFELGGDSIQSIQIASLLREEGYNVSVKDIFLYQTVKDLAQHINKDMKKIKKRSLRGKFSLSPIQADFFSQNSENENYYHQAFWFDIKNVDIKILSQAFFCLQKRHDSLRLRFLREPTISQEYAEASQETFSFYDRLLTFNQLLNQLTVKLFQEINIEKGPIIRSVLFQLQQGYKLLIVVHHLGIDIMSWKVLIEDLEKIYLDIQEHKLIDKQTAGSSYKDWVYALTQYADSEELKRTIPYWNEVCSKIKPIIPISDLREKKVGLKQLLTLQLDQKSTQKIIAYISQTGKKNKDIFLAIVIQALRNYSDTNEISIMLEHHGRSDIFEGVDVSRTVGWFTTLFPVVIKMPQIISFPRIIQSIEKTVADIPHDGLGFGVIKYLRKKKDSLIVQEAPLPQVVFNYLGEISTSISGTLLHNAAIVTEYLEDPKNIISNQIEIDCYFKSDELFFEIRYSDDTYRGRDMKSLQANVERSLNELISVDNKQTINAETKFDLIEIDQERYQKIFSKFKNE